MDIYTQYPDLLDPQFVEDYDFEKGWTVNNPEAAMSELDVAVALLRTKGHLTQTARMLRRTRRAVSGFVARTAILTDLAEDIGEEFLDDVEMTYKAAALSGDGQAAKFFLSTKGKNRGFTQRQEMTGANGEPIQHEISPRELLFEKLSRLRE